MKRTLIIVLVVTLLALFAANATALKVDGATIGSSRQDRVANVSATFKVTNDGTTNLSTVTLSNTADSKYNMVMTPSTFSLNAGASQTVTVKGDIPLDHPAVETDSSQSDYLEEKAFKIGDITATAGTTTASGELKMQAANKIGIKTATLYCGDGSDKVSNGDKVDDLKPDTQNCYMDVTVENTFREKDVNDQRIGDVEFDTIDVEIEIDHDDFSVFETSTVDGLQADEEDDADNSDLEFDIDEDVPDRTYTMELRVSGYDENNAFHGEIWEIKLDVVRETYDIQIKNEKMTPAKMDCNGGTLKIDANLINLGKKDDDEVAAEVDIPDLGINVRRTGIDLDADDSTSVTFTIKIPEDVKEGVYPVNLNTYFKNTVISNTKTFELAIDKCEVAPADEEPEDTTPVDTTPNEVTVITPPVDTTTPSGAVPASPRARVRTDGSEFQESNTYLWLLGLIIALIAAIIIVILIVFFVRRPVE